MKVFKLNPDNSANRPELPFEAQDEVQRNLANHIMKFLLMEESTESTLLSIDGETLIAPKTINLIYGKTGTGKSTLTHSIAAALIHRRGNLPELMLRNEYGRELLILWIDTELFTNEFVKARNKIIRKAERNTHDYCLLPVRVQSLSAEDKLKSLLNAVKWLTKAQNKHVVVIADTITDLIGNFNDVEQTDRITTTLLDMVNNFDCTLLCVMHESNNKAIGHLGSSLERKSSSIVRINKKKGVLTIENKKNRNGKEVQPLTAEFGDGPFLRLIENKTEPAEQPRSERGRPQSIQYEQIDPTLIGLLNSGSLISGATLQSLSQRFQCSVGTIKKRLNKLKKGDTKY